MAERTYLRFSEIATEPGRKTKVWHVIGANHIVLGRVAFWAHWRRYVFFPGSDKLFDASCMSQISVFLSNETGKWREGLKDGKRQ